MLRTRFAAVSCAIALLTGLAGMAHAQTARTYKVRLSPVPLDGPPMMATIAGSGAVTATLTGNRLTITGSFEGLKSPATFLKLHRGMKGIRGPSIVDLTAPPSATSGQLSAVVELTPSQVEDLNRERLYLQLYSEKAADGNLWGWLLPQENKR